MVTCCVEADATPYELLLAALGSCTVITVAAYARHRQWPLDTIHVKLAHHGEYVTDCLEVGTRRGPLKRIEREIHLSGELSAEQRQRILEVAESSPVRRLITTHVEVVTRLL